MMEKRKLKYGCPNHPTRPGIVTKPNSSTPCWQCYLGDEAFFKRFGEDFYIKETI